MYCIALEVCPQTLTWLHYMQLYIYSFDRYPDVPSSTGSVPVALKATSLKGPWGIYRSQEENGCQEVAKAGTLVICG